MNRILIVDDERQILRMLRASLQSSGYEVHTAANGLEGLEQFEAQRPDLIISDLAMPEMDGLEMTRTVRRTADTPIIVLSVRETEAMKVRALDAGADDYLTKPFGIQELLARVRVQLRRRQQPGADDATIEVGDFVIDQQAHTTAVRGTAVHLTPKEFDLLLLMARAPARVLTHKVILRGVWGPAGYEQPEYVRVLIAALRRKIELTSGPKYIQNEPWIGYRFFPEGIPAAEA